MTADQEAVPLQAVLVAVQLHSVDDAAFSSSVAELHRLARTLGLTIAATITQRRRSFHAGTVVGSGKLKDLQALTGTGGDDDAGGAKSDDGNAEARDHDGLQDVDHDDDDKDEAAAAWDQDGDAGSSQPNRSQPIKVVLIDHDISPSQARNLEKATGAEVMDRTAVILEIFRRHARSRVAKAQVEIVRLQYLVPRLRESGAGKDRQRGGIGGKGAGESSLELDRRKIRDRIAELTRELTALAAEQDTQRARRRDMNRVALVGYTNAGKSTLMRALTGSEVYVADKLFATLDTTVRALTPEARPRILVSDTVGFIDKLPHGLVASFKSTLDEALEAGILAHVVDASDPGFERQLDVTTEVLSDIGAGDIPRLIIFNKIDRVGDSAAEEAATRALLERWPDGFVMSARRPDDVARLRLRLIAFFARDLIHGEVRVPYDRQQLRGEIFASCEVLGERYQEDAVIFDVRAHPAVLERLRAA
ncbi:MAG: GTPase HflX [Deltaproteobacteria bacterium]|nr:GTPase HflX [Deltaproteobacteria bacterium]